MSKYELSDALVANIVGAAEAGTIGSHLVAALISDLKPQIPLLAPTKVGAVVQTDSKMCAPDLSVFLRWASDEQTNHPWILREELDRKPYSTKEIGRIAKVLSEGVDL